MDAMKEDMQVGVTEEDGGARAAVANSKGSN